MTEPRRCRECRTALLGEDDSPVCALCRQRSYERWARRFDAARRAHRVRERVG